MADAKLTALSAIGTLGTDDLFYVVDDPGGSPLSRKATGSQLRTFVLGAAGTDNAVARWDTSVSPTALQDSNEVTITDDGGLSAIGASAFLFTDDTTGSAYLQGPTAFLTDTGFGSAGLQLISPAAALLTFEVTTAPGVNDAFIGSFTFAAKNSSSADVDYAFCEGYIDVATASSEVGRITFFTKDGAGVNNGTISSFGRQAMIYGGAQTPTDPDRLLHVEILDAVTNAVTYVQRLTHTTSGTPAASLGVGIEFEVETADGNQVGATIEVVATDVATTTADFDVVIKTMAAQAAAAERMRINNAAWLPGTDDAIQLGSTTKRFADLFLAEGGVINWDNGDATLTQVNNVVTLASADFVADNVTVNTALLPDANDGAALGSTTLQFADLFLAEGGVINWDNGDATLTQVNNIVTLASAGLAVTGGACTETVSVLTDGVTPALDASLGNVFTLSATADRVIAVPSNAVSGQKIVIRHLASGGARSMTLNTGAGGFRFGTDITALTSTASGKTDYVGCIYNAADSFWDVVAYVKGF